MQTMVAPDIAGSVHETTPRSAWVWTSWLLSNPEWKQRVADLAEDGGASHRRGLAYRERPTGSDIPDRARLARWKGSQAKLAALLPPAFRQLVPLLVLQPALHVVPDDLATSPTRDTVRIPLGGPVAADRLGRAQREAQRRLERRGHPDRRTAKKEEGAFLRFLASIDPAAAPLLVTDGISSHGTSLKLGQPLVVSATVAGAPEWRRFLPVASQRGHPAVGIVASVAHARAIAYVEPTAESIMQIPPSPIPH